MTDFYLDKTPTVGELIEILETLDPSLPVKIDIGDGEYSLSSIHDYSDSYTDPRITLLGD